MIIAHFFLRKCGGKHYIFVESTSSRGLYQPCPAAIRLVEVSKSGNRYEWLRKAYYAFSEKFPYLRLMDSMENSIRLHSDHPSFDLVFSPGDSPGVVQGSGVPSFLSYLCENNAQPGASHE